MNTLCASITTALILTAFSPQVFGSGAATKRESKSLSISESTDGNGLVVAMSEALARSLLAGMVGADLKCGADLNPEFAAMLVALDRGGRGSRATIRDDDAVITARRSGSSLRIDLDDADGDGGLQVKMPWAVAECLLDGSATLKAKDAASIRVKLVGADGGSFEFKVD